MPRSSQNDSAPALAAEVNTFARARSSSTLCVRALVCHSLVLQRKLIVADSRQTDPYLELKRACEAVMEWAHPDFMYAHRPTVLRPPSYAHRPTPTVVLLVLATCRHLYARPYPPSVVPRGRYDHLAVTQNFVASAHVDMRDTSYQYALPSAPPLV